jgi:phosphoribosylamine--glycine ligase
VKKRQKASIRKNNIKWVNYDGYIGCVTVSTGFVVVRRNNRVAISGNTGGMGSYSNAGYVLPFLTKGDYENGLKIMQKTVDAFRKETGIDYKGFLYGGFIVTKDGVKVIEFNARLGDPEAMNILSILKTDFIGILERIIDGNLKDARFEKKATVCKYLVPKGYPDSPKKDAILEVDEEAISRAGAKVYYAAVNEKEGKIYTSSSRSIGILGIGKSIYDAEKIAESAIGFVKGEVDYRKDIGTKELVEKRIRHMAEIRS